VLRRIIGSREFSDFSLSLSDSDLAHFFFAHILHDSKETLYAFQNDYLPEESAHDGNKKKKIRYDSPLTDELTGLNFEKLVERLQDFLSLSRFQTEYNLWKELYVNYFEGLEKGSDREAIGTFFKCVEDPNFKDFLPIKYAPEQHHARWTRFMNKPAPTNEYYQRWITWIKFEERVGNKNHEKIVLFLRKKFGFHFSVRPVHNTGELLYLIVESSKPRSDDDAVCRNTADRLSFTRKLLYRIPELLLLIDNIINNAHGLLNHVPIRTHCDYSEIYDEYMDMLCREYNVERVGLN